MGLLAGAIDARDDNHVAAPVGLHGLDTAQGRCHGPDQGRRQVRGPGLKLVPEVGRQGVLGPPQFFAELE
jgi:hypothetical protein